MARDPEIEALLRSTRDLTIKAFNLSRRIDDVVDDLVEFSQEVKQSRESAYTGEERRGRER